VASFVINGDDEANFHGVFVSFINNLIRLKD
jgi:hypothetical protein